MLIKSIKFGFQNHLRISDLGVKKRRRYHNILGYVFAIKKFNFLAISSTLDDPHSIAITFCNLKNRSIGNITQINQNRLIKSEFALDTCKIKSHLIHTNQF